VHAVLAALKGLQALSDVPVLVVDGPTSVSAKDGKQEISLKLLNNFGQPFPSTKTVKAVLA